jgi:hypothetical protein
MRKNIHRIAILFVAIVSASGFLFSQTTITKSLQSLRPGDNLTKQQIEYKDPGRRGSNVLWDFSKLKPVNDKYAVRYYTPVAKRGGDSISITCLENRTMYKYVGKGDSLLLMGFENSGSRMMLESPEYVMHYPFTLGDSIVSTFKGGGSYEHTLSSGTEGQLYVVADAVGTLILPDGDTLYNVLRVKTQHRFQQHTRPLSNHRRERMMQRKDSLTVSSLEEMATTAASDSSGSTASTSSSSATSSSTASAKNSIKDFIRNSSDDNHHVSTGPDSINFRTETYRWYAPGYRYPLFETLCNRSRKSPRDTSEMGDIATAFYFPPSQHTYLENDPENKAVLDSLERLREDLRSSPADSLLFDYNFYPNPVRTDLNVELLLDLPSTVVFSVYTTSGQPVMRIEEGYYQSGLHAFTLNLSKLRFGEYLLYVQVNKQTAQSVLLKK